MDKNGGGTLSVGNDTGNSSVTYTVTDPDKSITVTAVPAEGHVFVKWSDGLTSKTRTDTDFKQNLDVTAVFGTASVHITSEGKGAVGSSYTFKADLERQVRQDREPALVRQRSGGHAGRRQVQHHCGGGQLHGQRFL